MAEKKYMKLHVYDYMIRHYSSNVEVPYGDFETNLVLVLLDASILRHPSGMSSANLMANKGY